MGCGVLFLSRLLTKKCLICSFVPKICVHAVRPFFYSHSFPLFQHEAYIEKMLNNSINISCGVTGSRCSIDLRPELSINNRQRVQERKVGRKIVKTIGAFIVDRRHFLREIAAIKLFHIYKYETFCNFAALTLIKYSNLLVIETKISQISCSTYKKIVGWAAASNFCLACSRKNV